MSRRKYTIRRNAGERLTQQMRETLGTAWNQYVNRLVPISLREFARLHNVPYETWRREFRRGAASPIIRQGNRWTYPEYDLGKAIASINEGKGNMGARMKLTMPMAIIFRYYVTVQKRSPYDARQYVVEALPGRDVQCLRTFYNHIEAGDMGVHHGDTPYHPGRRRQRVPAHPARTVPGRRTLRDRPRAADERVKFTDPDGEEITCTMQAADGTLAVSASVSAGCQAGDVYTLAVQVEDSAGTLVTLSHEYTVTEV